uniref:Presenilin n=1 Tax=Eutreptiella gymnastica TaxID=73025 RepID=A0A7S4LJX9_9EUGL
MSSSSTADSGFDGVRDSPQGRSRSPQVILSVVDAAAPNRTEPLLDSSSGPDHCEVDPVHRYSDFTMSLLYPVSITMIVVIWAIHTLTPLVDFADQQPLYLVYTEKDSDSDGTKFSGALLNALGVVCMFVTVTFLLVLLYKYRFIKTIVGWFVLTSFFLLFQMGWMWVDLFCTAYQIPYNTVPMVFVMFNFAVVGLVSIFWRGAQFMTQGYLICVSCMMGWFLSRLPEWTTWGVLAAVAIYDIVAVLAPKGPLKVLVEESQKRNEPIPGLVYESKSFKARQRLGEASRTPNYGTAEAASSPNADTAPLPLEAQQDPPQSPQPQPQLQPQQQQPQQQVPPELQPERQPADVEAPEAQYTYAPMQVESLKLGLGDFVFYSVLVARAAMYFYITWAVCMAAVLMGLCATLFCLGIFRKALPALPISIALGILFYFLTRFLLIPYYMEFIMTGHWA